MIFTDRTITVRKGESRIDEPIVVYRGDYELEVRFTILNSRFKFMSGTNMIESEKASYGQLAILTPYGGNIFSDIVRCNDGSVTFVLTADMLNQIEEVGLYSFQIRLMDYNKESRVSIPPIEFGIEVREPIASEDHDNSVNNAIVGYSIAKVVNPEEENVGDTFDEDGNYNKTKWETGDRISEGKLNKIEDAIDKVNQNETDNTVTLSKRIDNNFNVLDATKADTATTDSLQNQINNLILESGGDSNLEVVQARGDFQTLGMRLNNIEDELFPLAISHDGVVYDSVIDRINGTFSSIIDSDYNSWPHGIFELGYNMEDTWKYRDYDVTNNIENNVEYVLSYDKANGFVNTGMGSVIFYNGDDTEIARIAIKQKTHFKAPSETVKTIIRFQPISGDPAPNAGIATVSGIRLSKSDIIKLGDDVHIPVLDRLLEKHFGSLNLFDKNTVSDGVYMGGDGVIYPNAAYVLSDYIPVKRDISVVCNKHIRFVVFFDSSYNNYEYLENVSYPFNAKNDGYMRISISKSDNVSDTMINYGTTALPYTKYDVTDQLIEVMPLKDDISSLEEKTKHIIPYSQNLFDKRAITEGYYCNENGNLKADEKYFISDYIPVQPRDVLWSNTSARFFSYFNEAKQFIGYDAFIENKELDDNTYYVRITYFTTSINSDIMVNTGEDMLPFKEYDERMSLDVVTELEERVDVIEERVNDDISSLEEKTKHIIPYSQNLFDKRAITEGYYCNENGNLKADEKYFISDYIPVQPRDVLWSNTSARFFSYFNEAKQFIGYDTLIKNKELDDNTYYVRITYYTTSINSDIMVNTGEDMLPFKEYDERMSLDVVTELEERVDVIEERVDLFTDVFIDDIKNSPNLANPELFVENAYTLENGLLGKNPTYFVTDVISVKPGDKIQSNTRARFLATYDINGVFIENRYSDILVANKVYIVEDGVYGVRYTFWADDISNIMVYLGEEYISYKEFGIYYVSPLADVVENIERSALQSNSMIGGNAANITTDELVSGNILKLSDFPNNLKKGTCLSFYCNFDSFDTIEIGKGGEGVYRSDWIKIDNTNITLVHYENSLPVQNKKTVEHGLNISKFIGITMSCDDEGVAHINFITLGGYFKWDVNVGYEFNGTPFVRAGSDLTNVTLSATNVNFRKPVWLFGDSYFGVGDNRVIGQLKNLGYFDFLVDGLAGQNSNGAFGELEKCLRFGTPKYLVWCLGMNDSDDSYKTVLNKVRSIAKDNGITLIAMKIPSVPTRIHEVKNDYIESIGIRYVDSYTAVGAMSDGTWYDGYLYGDEVHPTNKGATAIAMRILIDVPEILQYGMSKLDKASGDISGDL